MTRASAQPRVIIRRNTNSARTTHYVCFNCRKQFKKPSTDLYKISAGYKPIKSVVGTDEDVFDYPCPQCGQRLRMVGKNFRAPKQTDVEGWQIAERLLDAGFSHSYTAGFAYPKRLSEVTPFLQRWRASEGEKLLTQWAAK